MDSEVYCPTHRMLYYVWDLLVVEKKMCTTLKINKFFFFIFHYSFRVFGRQVKVGFHYDTDYTNLIEIIINLSRLSYN